MKNLFFLVSVFIGLVACNKSNTLLDQAEDFLLSSLKDPSSYEKISAQIMDSVKYSTTIEEELDQFYTQEIIDAGIYKQSTKDSLKNILMELKANPLKDKVKYISINIKYRAKNSFGALDIGNATIYYFTEAKSDQKPFMIYSNK